MLSRLVFFVWCCVGRGFLPCSAQSATDVALELVSSDKFGVITDIQSTGDDSRLFVVNRRGVIRIIEDPKEKPSTTLATPFLDISGRLASIDERGLLGLAFDPDYASNGFFYVNYISNEASPPKDTSISRFSRSASNPNVADETSELIIAIIEQPRFNHNGGQLQFGPDGYLYIALGDGGGGGDPFDNSANKTSLLGKILRVDVRNMDETIVASPGNALWTIPPNNPFVGDSTALDEIWAYGVRNPWRISFDRDTGDLWVADVGQRTREEVNVVPASSVGGENYGWRNCEGTAVFKAPLPDGCKSCSDTNCFVVPVLEYDHSVGISVTGGYVYRGKGYSTELGGTYFYADYGSGNLFGARMDSEEKWSNVITSTVNAATTFGEDSDGELYVGSFDGSLHRIRPGGATTTPEPTPAPATMNEDPIETPMNPALECPEQYDETIELSDFLMLSYSVIIPNDSSVVETYGGILCVQLVYDGIGWIGFAVSSSDNGEMVGSEAIIGLPAEPEGPSSPGKYKLEARSLFGISSDDVSQTLQDASITQDTTSTTLSFGKLLKEAGEIEIDGFGSNTFLWAVGADNPLAYHAARGSFVLDFSGTSNDSYYAQLDIVFGTNPGEASWSLVDADTMEEIFSVLPTGNAGYAAGQSISNVEKIQPGRSYVFEIMDANGSGLSQYTLSLGHHGEGTMTLISSGGENVASEETVFLIDESGSVGASSSSIQLDAVNIWDLAPLF